nr:TolC family protein [Litoribacter populi]
MDYPYRFFSPQKGRIQAARIQQEIAHRSFEQTQFEYDTQVRSLEQQYRKWLSSRVFYEEEALPLAKEQREGAMLAFREGEIDYVTLIQNLNESLQLEKSALEVLGNYLQTRFQLEFYLNPDLP